MKYYLGALARVQLASASAFIITDGMKIRLQSDSNNRFVSFSHKTFLFSQIWRKSTD
jgi:hypothetical protein